MLKSNDNKFVPITYEDFFDACLKYSPNSEFKKWPDYLFEHYIVKDWLVEQAFILHPNPHLSHICCLV